jgi:acetyl esterase/lipase
MCDHRTRPSRKRNSWRGLPAVPDSIPSSPGRRAGPWPGIGEELATLGYVAYDINYCFAGKSVSGYPTQVQDVQDALVALTKPGFDSNLVTVAKTEVATWGGSAGATLAVDAAVDLGTTSKTAPVVAMVGWSGGYDFLDFRGGTAKNEVGPEAFLGCDPMTDKSTQCQATAGDGSAVNGVTPTTPAMSLWNSTDELVPVYQFDDMKQALKSAGVPVDATLNGGSYATAHANAYTNKAFCPSVAFISTYLGQPKPTNCVAPANPTGGGN